MNTLTVSGLSFADGVNGVVGADGVGIVVIYEDGATLADIQFRDGLDQLSLLARQLTDTKLNLAAGSDEVI